MSKEKKQILENQINQILTKVAEKLYLDNCEFQLCKDENQEPDEANWKTVVYPVWATSDGTAYIRYKLEIPKSIEGIDIEGCDIDLCFVFPSGMTLFIDNKEIYSQKFWVDMRPQPLKIFKNVKPGSVHTILFKVPKGDGHGGIHAFFNIEKIQDTLFELKSINYQFELALAIAEKMKSENLQKTIELAMAQINISDLKERNWEKVLSQIKKAEEILEPFRRYAKKINIHLIGHAHIDMNWLWTYDETKRVCVRDFTSMVALMEEFPAITFSQSQSHVYKIVEEENPELFSKVQKRIKEKRWEVTANAWVENDLNTVCGESLVRHILYSKKYAKEKLGGLSPIMWCPDEFGHPATIPSIIADAGIKYYFHMRCGKDYPLYIWEGPDKSQVIAFKTVYNNAILPERIIPPLLKFIRLYPEINDVMFPYGIGDHGGGPTRTDYRMKKKMEEKPCFPNFIFSTTEKYFKTIERFRPKLPVVKGELNTIFEGCYTTHSDIKDINRKCEDTLVTLESILALYTLRNGRLDEKDTEKLENLWQKTLFNQFHDILCGSAIKAAYQYSVEMGNQVVSEAKSLIEKYGKMIPEKGESSLVLFNPAGWETSAIVHIQSENKDYLVEKIPASGFVVKNSENFFDTPRKTIVQKSQTNWETEFYQISIDPETGTIRSLYDRKNKRIVLNTAAKEVPEDPSSWWAETSSNLISVYYEQPHRMSAWIIGNIISKENLFTTEKIETDQQPFRTIITVKRRYKSSQIIQKTILYPEFPYIDFETIIDWNETGNGDTGVPMLRTNFCFDMENPSTYYETPFGSIKRRSNGKECPGLRWAAMKEKNYWAGLITKNRHGFNASGNNLSITLLRNAYEPDSQSDTGHHEISYRLFFGKLNEIEITKKAMEFTMPVVVIETKAKPGERFSPFEIKGNVVPVSLKPSIDSDGVVMRFVEMLGKQQKFTVSFYKKPEKIYRVNIAEEVISKIKPSKTINLTIPAYGIISLKIKF